MAKKCSIAVALRARVPGRGWARRPRPSPRRSAVLLLTQPLLLLDGMSATAGAPTRDGETGATIVSVSQPDGHFTLLRAPSGRYLAAADADDDGTLSLATSRWSTDATAFRETTSPGGGTSTFTHALTGLVLTGSLAGEDAGESPVEGFNGRPFRLQQADGGADLDENGGTEGQAASFVAQQGPADLPSAYVSEMRETGWTCLPALVHPEALAVLRALRDDDIVTPEQRRQRMLAATDGSAGADETHKQPFLRSSVLARVAVDPTVMYVLRQYLRSNAVQAAHIPSILTALPVDNEKYPGPQGWCGKHLFWTHLKILTRSMY
jgi:hypothetical protein